MLAGDIAQQMKEPANKLSHLNLKSRTDTGQEEKLQRCPLTTTPVPSALHKHR